MHMITTYTRTAAVLAALLASLSLVTSPTALAATAPGVAWQSPASGGDVDPLFAKAKAEKRPVLLYWGAKWCPWCNRLKATLFNRADFADMSRAYVAVEIDGDAPGAQKLGARFKVNAYPALILFNPDGSEFTRLPGEMDAAEVLNVMQLGIAGGRSVKDVLTDATAGKRLSVNEWRMLSFQEWDQDERLGSSSERTAVLSKLAKASEGGDEEASTRLWLKSLAAMANGSTANADQLPRLLGVLKDAGLTRKQMGVLMFSAPKLVQVFAPEKGERRTSLVAALDSALARLTKDETLSPADRLLALQGRVDLARMDAPRDELHPTMPAPLLAEVRDQVARHDREVTNPYERQAVIPAAAQVLSQAGLWAESDSLLKAGLARSHSAHYLMGQLAGNAMRQGRTEEALRWSAEAFAKSEGPATRLQWGASHLRMLVRVSPGDTAKIESTASQLFGEAAKDPGAFYERSESALKRIAGELARWNKAPAQAAAVSRLKSQLGGLCGQLSADPRAKASCENLVKLASEKG